MKCAVCDKQPPFDPNRWSLVEQKRGDFDPTGWGFLVESIPANDAVYPISIHLCPGHANVLAVYARYLRSILEKDGLVAKESP